MALTNNSHLFASFNESAFNSIIRAFMSQRPSTFNYATQSIIDKNLSCSRIDVHPALLNKNIDLWTKLEPIAIPGGNASQGVNYCVQLNDLKLDFTPTNTISLPRELGSALDPQEIAMSAKVCAAIACKNGFTKTKLPDVGKVIGKFNKKNFNGIRSFTGLTSLKLHCFCLELVATLKILRDNTHLKVDITGVELKNIEPEGLENSLECFIMQILDVAVLPKLKIALSDLIFDAEGYFTVIPTPVSTSVPFNPSVKNNNLSVFININ